MRCAEAYAVLFKMVQQRVAEQSFLDRISALENDVKGLKGQDAMAQVYHNKRKIS